MPTLNEITSDIRNIATSGENQYSFRIEDEQIEFWIHEIRSMLISQAISKRENLSDNWIQSIKCLEMELVDSSECCFLTTNCKILKSKKKLPPTIEYYNDNLIIRVTTATGNVISKSNAFKIKYEKYNKYTTTKPNWFIENEYLYITNADYLQYVNVYGLFENPSDLANYINCQSQSCFNIDSDYPVSLKMASDITNIVLQTKIYPFLSIPKDTSNDAQDDSQLSGGPKVK